jgi:hypothetical protein
VHAFSKMHPKVCAHERRTSRGPLPIVVGTLVLVEVDQTGSGMDHTSGKAPRAGRPVDVAGGGRFHPAEAGADARSEHEVPWERHYDADGRTPMRFHRVVSALLAELDTPARPPKPCGPIPNTLGIARKESL